MRYQHLADVKVFVGRSATHLAYASVVAYRHVNGVRRNSILGAAVKA